MQAYLSEQNADRATRSMGEGMAGAFDARREGVSDDCEWQAGNLKDGTERALMTVSNNGYLRRRKRRGGDQQWLIDGEVIRVERSGCRRC